MKHILLLSMGGTIASVSNGEGLEPQFSPTEMIRLIPQLNGLCQISYLEVASLDSTNVQPEEWKLLARSIYENISLYDGFVITHGTDTMAYTASAITYMLQGLTKPVILTGAQLPIDFPGTDARENILNAFRTAITGTPGVYILFDGKIIEGTRASKLYSQNFSAFHSINAQEAGSIVEGKALFTNPARPAKVPFQLADFADPRVLVYKLIPGADPKIIDMAIEIGYRGIVIEAYGAGGVPTYRRNFIPTIQRATEKGVVVICATQCVFDGIHLDTYQVGVLAQKAGAISTHDKTIEAISTKLMWALGQTEDAQKAKKILQD